MNVSSSAIYENILLELNNDSEIKSQQIKYYPNSNKTAVILDPRFNPLMEAVIRNFMYFMNPDEWNLCIISYSGYENLIKTIFPNCIFKAIDAKYIYFKNDLPNIEIISYNEIFLSTEFWKNIPGEHIFIFQTDCIMYKMFPYYYLLYDYCGANYYNSCSPIYVGINGGCSLRKKSTMIECIEKINWNIDVPEYKTKLITVYKKYKNPINFNKINYRHNEKIYFSHNTKCNEDVFFTHACEILMKCVPDNINRTFFSTEVDINIHTCVHHGWNKNYHTNIFAIEILNNSTLFNRYINKMQDVNKVENIKSKNINQPENVDGKLTPLLGNIYDNIAD